MVQTANASDVGNYTVIVVISGWMDAWNASFTLFVTPEGFCTNVLVTAPTLTNRVYNVYGPMSYFYVGEFETQPAVCIYGFEEVSFLNSSGDPALPYFILFDEQHSRYQVISRNNSDAGTYWVRL